MEAKASKGFVTYMLTCDNCRSAFESKDGFPKQQLCPRCLIVFKAGIKEVVDYFFYEAGLVGLMGCMTMAGCISLLPNWQAKLKEWGIKEDQ